MKPSNDTLEISNSGDMSQATLTSEAVRLDHQYLYTIQAIFTGAPVGTLKLQASNDDVKESPVNWTDLSITAAVSAAGSAMLKDTDVGYKWGRLVYTKTSGTGTLAAKFNAKGI